MNVIATNQAYLFFIFMLTGVLISILFDIFRVFRKTFKTPDIITYLEDILFWILTGSLTLFVVFKFNNGEIRFFLFLGMALGIILYLVTLSKYFIKLNVWIIITLKNILKKLITIILYPIKGLLKMLQKIFYKPIVFAFINFKKIFAKKLKNVTKKSKKTKNNEKKAVQNENFNI